MIFDRNEQKEVIALLGAGSMRTAIVRRIAAGKTVLLGDINPENLEKAAHDFQYSGYSVETCVVDATDRTSIEAFARKAASLGPVKVFINTAGASPNQAKPEHILKLDLMGTGYAVDAFGGVLHDIRRQCQFGRRGQHHRKHHPASRRQTKQPFHYFLASILSLPKYGRSAGGMTTEPSACWKFSKMAANVRPTANPLPFKVCTY